MRASELPVEDQALLQMAADYRDRSYAPISNYRVGAALRAVDGSVHGGCNVENIVLALTCCAEKVALYRAVSDGAHPFEAVAVVTESSPPAAPCGGCRQLLNAWGVRRVVLANPQGEVLVLSMDELLPHAFALREPLGPR